MKLLNLIVLLIFIGIFNGSCTMENEAKSETEEMAVDTTPERLLRHAVMFKFQADISADTLSGIENAFAALPSKIPEIIDFEWGLNNSPEGLDKGFTHFFFVTFASEESRATYLPHPDHLAFVALLGNAVEDVMVMDYWASN